MKLTIRPVPELGKRVFTSSDVVTGLIYLDINDSLSISQIEFSIKARLHSAETGAAGLEPAGIPRFYPVRNLPRPITELFESSQVLFPRPPLDQSARYTLGKGRHEYRFGIDFSLLSLHAQAELTHNHYLRTYQHFDKGRIYYIISVTVKGCGLFRRPARKSVYLVAATLDPPGIPRLPPSKGLLRQSCQVVNLGACALQSEPDGEDGKVPPLYTPAIVLRAGISSDGGLLYASDALPLKLWITVPSVAQGQLKAVLKSVCLFLVDPTVVSDHGRRVVRPAGTFIREVQLDITMQAGSRNETFEVDPASWKCCRVPRSLPITKPTQKVVQPYLLQILCEFSCDGMASSTFTSVLVPLDIATANAPPKYEAHGGQCRHVTPMEGLPEYESDEDN